MTAGLSVVLRPADENENIQMKQCSDMTQSERKVSMREESCVCNSNQDPDTLHCQGDVLSM